MWEQNVCNIIMLTVCMENGRVGQHRRASMCPSQAQTWSCELSPGLGLCPLPTPAQMWLQGEHRPRSFPNRQFGGKREADVCSSALAWGRKSQKWSLAGTVLTTLRYFSSV